MFDSLDEQIKKDEDRISTPAGRMMRWAIYAIAGLLVFGGVFLGVSRLS